MKGLFEKRPMIYNKIFGMYLPGCKSPWKSTSKDLPPKGVTVVLRIRIDSGVIFRTDYIDDTGKWAMYNLDCYKVTHWIECPIED